MPGSLLDDVARTLAEPVSRGRALRLLGAATLAAALPGIRPLRARAANGSCPAGETLCQGGLPTLYTCCGGAQPVCCSSPSAVLCCKAGCSCGTDERGYPDCVNCPRCAPGLTECGPFGCCPQGKHCRSTTRTLCCGQLEAGCGSRCCAGGLRCAKPRDGTCEKCPPGRKGCGRKCCPKGTYCCDAGKGLCCKKKGGGCCNVGEGGVEDWICCNSPNRCLTRADESGTYPRGAPRVCCPPERAVPSGSNYITCCPPGYLSLGGKLVVPAGGGGGLCCRKDKVCGSGRNITCCSTGSPTVPELETHCCDGRCANLRFDPQNCGACGTTCPSGACQNGVCV